MLCSSLSSQLSPSLGALDEDEADECADDAQPNDKEDGWDADGPYPVWEVRVDRMVGRKKRLSEREVSSGG
jgi:hypothetical protein